MLARDPDRVRGPDVSFVRSDRIPPGGVPEGFWELAPDLAVEVVSPTETAEEVRAKVRDFLAAGTRLVRVIDPRTRELIAHLPDGSARALAEGDRLESADVLPGFSCAIADLFDGSGTGWTFAQASPKMGGCGEGGGRTRSRGPARLAEGTIVTAAGFNHPYLTLLLLIACFAITLFVSMKLRREVDEDAKPTTPRELFGPLERAYHAGLMHEAEYLRIRDQMERANAEAASAKAKPAARKPARPADEWASWDTPDR